MKKLRISVIGMGFVGLSLAVINAHASFETIGVESNKEKLASLRRGRTDFYEPNLSKYLSESLKKNKISFTENLDEVKNTDITFVTVGTPSTKDGKIDLSSLKKVISGLYRVLKNKQAKHLVVIKSTVVPTTTSTVIVPMLKNLKNVSVVVNPEFLREGSALDDLISPHLIVIGCSEDKNCQTLEKYYKQFYKKMPDVINTDYTTAEMIKYANNAFLATKISFINSIANICQKLPLVDVNTIAHAIGKDPRIGPQFLQAGPGFGGSCLPKDLSALIKFTDKFQDLNSFFKAVENVNQLQTNQILGMLKSMKLLDSKNTIAVLGLAFKKDTDDLREAVSIRLIKDLLKKRLKVRVHDPMAIENFKKIFGNKVSYCTKIEDCLKSANCCIVLTEWDDYKKLKPSILKKNMKGLNIIDARRILDPSLFQEFNFQAIGLGPR
jgi:UDPglucose 6-dehydrogenase